MSDYSINTAKILLLLVFLSMVVLVVWSIVNVIQGYTTQVYNGIILGLSTVSAVLLGLLFFRSTCDFS